MVVDCTDVTNVHFHRRVLDANAGDRQIEQWCSIDNQTNERHDVVVTFSSDFRIVLHHIDRHQIKPTMSSFVLPDTNGFSGSSKLLHLRVEQRSFLLVGTGAYISIVELLEPNSRLRQLPSTGIIAGMKVSLRCNVFQEIWLIGYRG